MSKTNLRFAVIDNVTGEQIETFLPSNYSVVATGEEGVLIAGRDSAGWTLDDYVLPRLASGLFFGKEITLEEATAFSVPFDEESKDA